MPTYDYRCDHCGHTFSAVQSFHDEPVGKCPKCGKRPRRLISASSIVFKGSGWYKTDSRTSKGGSDGDSGKTEKPDKKAGAEPAGASGKVDASSGGDASDKGDVGSTAKGASSGTSRSGGSSG